VTKIIRYLKVVTQNSEKMDRDNRITSWIIRYRDTKKIFRNKNFDFYQKNPNFGGGKSKFTKNSINRKIK